MTGKRLSMGALKTAALLICILLLLTQAIACQAENKKTVITVSLSEKSVSMLAGYTQKLSAVVKENGKSTNVAGTWATENKNIVTVDRDGLVMGISAGECKVYYSVGNTVKAGCMVTVTPSCNWTTVLMYHYIAETGNKLRVPQADFDAEMKWLHDNNYNTLSLDELYGYISEKKPFPPKTAVITFDDGYTDTYNGAVPVILKYHLHATVFVISGYLNKDGFLTTDEVKDMSNLGCFDIECHTVSHPNLDTLSYDQQYKELSESKQTLETLTGKKIEYLAYPSGRYNSDTISIAKSLGYKMCFKMEGGSGTLNDNVYEFPRSFVDKHLNTLIDAVNGLGY